EIAGGRAAAHFCPSGKQGSYCVKSINAAHIPPLRAATRALWLIPPLFFIIHLDSQTNRPRGCSASSITSSGASAIFFPADPNVESSFVDHGKQGLRRLPRPPFC